MLKRVIIIMLVVLAPVAASAQVFEIGAHAGYTLSDGIKYQGIEFNQLEPTDAFSWGFAAGARVQRGYGIGFMFDRQQSQLEASGPRGAMELSDMNVDNYHGIISFDYPFPQNPAMAGFFFLGFGATSFGEVTIPAVGTIDGPTEFSTTWGAGLKVYPNDGPIGFRGFVRWTPTYIKTDPDGYWCDPYWGCTTYGDPDYVHQVEFAGGISYRFATR